MNNISKCRLGDKVMIMSDVFADYGHYLGRQGVIMSPSRTERGERYWWLLTPDTTAQIRVAEKDLSVIEFG